jgi:hypothetical protein
VQRHNRQVRKIHSAVAIDIARNDPFALSPAKVRLARPGALLVNWRDWSETFWLIFNPGNIDYKVQ